MTGSSTPNPAPNSAPNSIATPKSYNAEFPALPLPSQRLRIAPDSKFVRIEHELAAIMKEPSLHVQLERPVCLSPTNIKNRVVGVITGTGWNPPISLVDRAEWKDAYNAYKRANVKFDTEGKLGEYPPLMIYPPVHH